MSMDSGSAMYSVYRIRERANLGRAQGDWVAMGGDLAKADLYPSIGEKRVHKEDGSL